MPRNISCPAPPLGPSLPRQTLTLYPFLLLVLLLVPLRVPILLLGEQTADSPSVRKALSWIAKAERAYGSDSSPHQSPMKKGSLAAAADDEVRALRRKISELTLERDASRGRAQAAEADVERLTMDNERAKREVEALLRERDEAAKRGGADTLSSTSPSARKAARGSRERSAASVGQEAEWQRDMEVLRMEKQDAEARLDEAETRARQ